MGKYLALRIEAGKLSYGDVVDKYPQYKDEIDEILAEKRGELGDN